MTRFIAIDPASKLTGWAVFQEDQLVAWGLIDSRNAEYSFRPQFIINELNWLLQRYNFQEVAVESAPRFKGTRAAALEMVVNSIKAWTRGLGLPFAAYNVSSWKKSAIGDYLARKDTVGRNILLRFPSLAMSGLTEHEFDAIGIGVHHAGILRLQGMAVAAVEADFARCVKCGGPVEGGQGKKGFSICRKCAGDVADGASPADRLALAKTGIDALIDEATGYEGVRPSGEVSKRFRKYRGKGGN